MGDNSKNSGGGGNSSGESQMMTTNQGAVMMSQQNMQAIQLQQGLESMATSQANGQLLGGGQVLQQQLQSSMATSLTQPPIGSISLQGNVGQSNTTITTMAANQQPQQLQQVQVIQQPMQNYVQQVYNTQGQMLMQMHPQMNPSIQVIAKPFQSNQLTSHVIGKPAIVGNQQSTFPSYATIPTTNSQTLVIAGQLISGQLQNSQAKQELQKSGGVKASTGASGASTQQQVATLQGCVVSQPLLQHLISPIQYTTCTQSGRATVTTPAQPGPPMQLATPWQLNHTPIPHIWTQHHPQVIATQNPIFIRNQQEQPMFIQSPQPQQNIQQQQQPQQQQNVATSGAGGTQSAGKDAKSALQVSRTMSILPSATQPIRPATSMPQHVIQKQPNKFRTKPIITKANPPPQKLDAQNQTKPMNAQQIIPGAKMIITQQGTIVQQDPLTGKVTAQHQAVAGMAQQGILMPQQMIQQNSLQGIQMGGIVVDQPVSEPAKMPEVATPPGLPTTQESESSPMAVDESIVAPETSANGSDKMETDKEDTSSLGSASGTASAPVEEAPKEVKSGPPKAMVKPQVLTHIIEGYVIQESSEPFPINRNNLPELLAQSVKSEAAKSPAVMESEEPPMKKQNLDAESESGKIKCLACDKVDIPERFIGKACSTACSKRISSMKKDDMKTDKELIEADLEADNLTDDNLPAGPISNPVKWTVSEVCDFIKNLPGCSDYVEDFAIQEIDGQALMLLKADHLMSAMSMKLGPALKICNRIDKMRAEHEQAQGTPQPA